MWKCAGGSSRLLRIRPTYAWDMRVRQWRKVCVDTERYRERGGTHSLALDISSTKYILEIDTDGSISSSSSDESKYHT